MNQRAKDLAMLKSGIIALKSDKLERISQVDSEDEVLELVRDMQRINVIIDELDNNFTASPRRVHMKKCVLITAIRDLKRMQSELTRTSIKKGKSIYISDENKELGIKADSLVNKLEKQQEYIIRLSLAVGEDSIKDAINSKPNI